MYEKLEVKLDRIFENAPKTNKAKELKEELMANLIDKYNDFIASGKNEDQAVNLAIASVGDVDKLIRELKENYAFDGQQLKGNSKKSASIMSMPVVERFKNWKSSNNKNKISGKFKVAVIVSGAIILIAIVVILAHGIKPGKDKEVASSNVNSTSKEVELEKGTSKIDGMASVTPNQNNSNSSEKKSEGIVVSSNTEGEVQKDVSVTLGDCNNISLDFSSENISITVTNEDKFRVVEKANKSLKEDEKFTCEKSGNAINIKEGAHNDTENNMNLNKGIELFIPKFYNKDLNIQSRSGNIKINGDLTLNNILVNQNSGNLNSDGSIVGDNATLTCRSGNISAKELLTKKYKIEATSGNICIKSILGSGDIKASSGLIELSYKDILEYSNIETGSGNVKLNVPKSLSVEFDAECLAGTIKSSFELNYENKNRSKAQAKIGNGPYKKITTKTTSGNININ